MNLNKQNFVKYIIFLGVIYAALKMVDNNESNKRRTLLILVGSLLIMICTDCMFNKSEEMTNVWEQAEQLFVYPNTYITAGVYNTAVGNTTGT